MKHTKHKRPDMNPVIYPITHSAMNTRLPLTAVFLAATLTLGAFHGPGHEEAWGVFDTSDYVGVFGAKRMP